MQHTEIIDFWFKEIEKEKWFKKDESFDETLRTRFGQTHQMATHCELAHWRQSPQGRLAEIIVLDQFSRNLYRGSGLAFAHDTLALALAQTAVAAGDDLELEPEQRAFLYMPYMHSESAVIHQQALKLFDQPGLENNYQYELRHKEIIDRFGRYPHRNEVLGRNTTPEEAEFLKQPGSSF